MSAPLKLPLHRRPRNPYSRDHERHLAEQGHIRADVLRSLPYVRSLMGAYVHRPRFIQFIQWPADPGFTGPHSWFAVRYWCGSQSTKNLLLQTPDTGILCATCEGRAVAQELPATDEILAALAFEPRSDWAVSA